MAIEGVLGNARLKEGVQDHIRVEIVHRVKQLLDLSRRWLSPVAVRRHFVFHYHDFVVGARDLPVDIQLELRDETFLHEAQERLERLSRHVLVLGLGLWQKLLFFLKDIDGRVDDHRHLHSQGLNVDLGFDPCLGLGEVLA